ncbi:MAG: hypothetical protein GY943_19680, partial [Chloroflexi bacterium]|nr:hypothetical protein [Chloroflexota bacterium]
FRHFFDRMGAATLLTGLLKPKLLWNNAKIQGFVTLLSEKGAMIFLVVIGALALIGGLLLLF